MMDGSTGETHDAELLRTFVDRHDERCFEVLVERYLGLVYGLAMRRTGDAALAEEVTQNVFILLARKSSKLTSHPTLGGWLAKSAANESIRLTRNERTRLRKMQEYRHEQAATHVPAEDGDPAWHEARPLLDQALGSLSAKDRDAIVLRFYEKRSFKSIAALLGKSDDTCQKQVSRAIDKLAKWFQRNGTAVSTGTLMAGLASTLGDAHATRTAAGPSAIASKAMTATEIHTSALISDILTSTMKAKLTSTAFILAALAISAGGGWVAGYSNRGTTPTTSAVKRGASLPAANSPASETAQASEDARRGSLRELLDTARNELQGHATIKRASIRAAARLSLIHPDDLPEAMKLLAEFDGGFQGNSTLAALLLERWAVHDGHGACRFALKNMKVPLMGLHPVSSPLRAWASSDPEAAMSWFQKHKNAEGQLVNVTFGDWGQISDVRWIMGAWALKDPVAAARAYRHLQTTTERSGARIGMAELGKRSTDRGALLDAIWDTPDIPDRIARDEVSTILREWAEYQPADLAEWIDANPESLTNHTHAAKQVLGHWLLEDTDAAIDWWMNARVTEEHKDRKLAGLIDAWAETDVYTAAEWLAKQAFTEAHARAVRTLSEKLSREDPERAFTWAQAVPLESERETALRSTYRVWHGKEPDRAEAALKTANLDEALRARLEESVTK